MPDPACVLRGLGRKRIAHICRGFKARLAADRRSMPADLWLRDHIVKYPLSFSFGLLWPFEKLSERAVRTVGWGQLQPFISPLPRTSPTVCAGPSIRHSLRSLRRRAWGPSKRGPHLGQAGECGRGPDRMRRIAMAPSGSLFVSKASATFSPIIAAPPGRMASSLFTDHPELQSTILSLSSNI